MRTLPDIIREMEGEVRAVDKSLPELRPSIPVLDNIARELPGELRAQLSGELRDGRLAARFALALSDAAAKGIEPPEQPLAAASALLIELTTTAGQLVRQRAKKAEGDARFLEGHRECTLRHLERLRPLVAPAPAPADETAAPEPSPAEQSPPTADAGQAIIDAELARPAHPDGFGGSDFPHP